MIDFNQKISLTLVKNVWKYYKKWFFLVFVLVFLGGIFFSYQFSTVTTESSSLLATNSTTNEVVDVRPAINNTYKDLATSNEAAELAQKNLKANGIDSYSNDEIMSSIEVIQTTSSQFVKLEVATRSKKSGEIITESVKDYANEQIEKSFPNNISEVISNPTVTKDTEIFNLKIMLVLILAGGLLGIITLILFETFSTRIIDPRSVENLGFEIITEVKKNGK